MAACHVGKRIVVSLDIKDFFHSIKQSQLYDFYKKIGFGEKPARTLSELCTYKAFVPQGALTSPKVSNIVASLTFGPVIKEYCDRKGLTLSIYADDVTISWTDTTTPVEVLNVVKEAITKAGFRVNTKKTKIMTKAQRQYVCGVVVNEKTNLIREERLRLRAIVHNVTVHGLSAEAAKNDETPEHFLEILKGKLNWLRQLNQPLGQKLMDKLDAKVKEVAAQPTLPTPAVIPTTPVPQGQPAPWNV